MGKWFGRLALIVGFVSAVLGIVVYVNDEVRARVFPDLAPATRADVQEQMRLSEERIAAVVQSSISTALADAESRGTTVSADEQVNYEAALTSLLASEDPTFNDAKFLALSGQPEAAAEELVTLAELTSGEAEPIPERDRASLLRSAGDILVPSDPDKALAAYRKAQQLDPDNQILATRIQQLSAQTAAANTVAAIPNAQFEFDGLLFEFEGCETGETLKCVLSVTNTTPDEKHLFTRSVWAIDEHSRWMQDTRRNVRASDHYTWTIPSLEASQIDVSFGRAANILQYLNFDLHVDNVSYRKTFRDIAVRGGRDVQVRQMRPIDPSHPERAFSVSGVQFHFLGCGNPDAPVCRFDLINNGPETAVINVRSDMAYDHEGVGIESVRPELDISGDYRGEVPSGITTGWTVNFRKPASYFQEYRASIEVNGDRIRRSYRDLSLGDGPMPEVKTLDAAAAFGPDGYFEIGGVEFAFMGCQDTLKPVCRTDVRNTTDAYVKVSAGRAEATQAGGQDVRSANAVVVMNNDFAGEIPPGLTTTIEHRFSGETASFDALNIRYSAGDLRESRSFSAVPVQ